MICATVHGPTLFDAKRQLNYASDYADMAELRMDLWANHRKEEVEKIVKEHPDIPLIFALKPHAKMTELKRLEEIEKLALLKPGYFEIEQEVPEEMQRSLMRKFPYIQWIITKHFPQWSEEAVTTYYEQHQREYPQTYLKITVAVTDALDALKLCRWVNSQRDEHLIGIAVGAQGQISHLLSPVIGNPWTYGSSDPKHTVQGFIPAETLRYTYRIKKNRTLTSFIVQLSSPISQDYHYLSHNAVLEHIQEPVLFVGMETKHLEEAWKELKQLPLSGAGVGRPYQEQLMPLLDYTDPIALKIGGVNTVSLENELSYGFNNEGFAVLDAVEKLKPVKGTSIGVLGADSSARAIAYEAQRREGLVTVYSQDSGAAKKIAYELGCREAPWGKWGDHTCWVNTVADATASSEIVKIPLKKGQIVVDLTISPQETPLLEKARAAEATPLGADVVLVQEGSNQFCLWFKERVAE